METLFESKDFTVKFNGKNTYFLIDPTGHCVFATDTLKKCKNHFTRIFA